MATNNDPYTTDETPVPHERALASALYALKRQLPLLPMEQRALDAELAAALTEELCGRAGVNPESKSP